MEKELTLPWGKDGMTCALMMTVGHLHKIIKCTSNSYCWVFFNLISFYMENIKNPTVDFLLAQSSVKMFISF